MGLPLAVLFAYCLLIYPWLAGRGSWDHVQNVWDRWQTFNAAALAFATTVLALQITRYKDEKQQIREFSVAKAFLPAAFSEMSAYFKSSAQTVQEAWSLKYPISSRHPKRPLSVRRFHPLPPADIAPRVTFRPSDCLDALVLRTRMIEWTCIASRVEGNPTRRPDCLSVGAWSPCLPHRGDWRRGCQTGVHPCKT